MGRRAKGNNKSYFVAGYFESEEKTDYFIAGFPSAIAEPKPCSGFGMQSCRLPWWFSNWIVVSPL
jgi:hypothetical protein